MAAIAPPQFQQQAVALPQQQFSASAPSRDPLFDALVKYVTSTPGPSAISAQSIQDILDAHINDAGGREYLESIVSPVPPTVWPNKGTADGYLSTNMNSLTLQFRARRGGIGIPLVISFRGEASGFFAIQPVCVFDNAEFFWGDQPPNGDVTFEIVNETRLNMVTVLFFDQVQVQSVNIPRTPVAELHIVPTMRFLLPPNVKGNGTFTVAQ